MILEAALGLAVAIFLLSVIFGLYISGTLIDIRDELHAIAEELRKEKS